MRSSTDTIPLKHIAWNPQICGSSYTRLEYILLLANIVGNTQCKSDDQNKRSVPDDSDHHIISYMVR